MSEYTYEHDPEASSEENVAESMKMDKIRATMGRNSEQLRKEQPSQNGHVEVKPSSLKPIPGLNGHNGLEN